MILDNYDDFNFMVILLFLYLILIGFIFIIIINNKHKAKQNPQLYSVQSDQYPQTTISSLFPQISGQKCTPVATEEQCL